MADAPDPWLPAAHLLRPQGRRGELLADPHAEDTVFTPGRTLWLAPSVQSLPLPGAERTLESAWQPTGKNAGRVVLKLAGVESITAAEALAGQFLLLRASELPALAPDTFRVRDLVGCALFDGERLAGTVVDVQFPIAADGRTRLEDAPDLLAIQPATNPSDAGTAAAGESAPRDEEPVLVPFVRAWLVAMDIPAKRIVMQLPSGILHADDLDPDELDPDGLDPDDLGGAHADFVEANAPGRNS